MSPANLRANILEELAQSDESLRAAEALVNRGFVMPHAECEAEVIAARQYIDTVRSFVQQGGWVTT